MSEHRGEKFSNQRVVLDGNAYIDCVFDRCTMVYRGTAVVTLRSPVMSNCGFELEGAADRTVQYLAMLYHGGARELVEELFAAVRGQPGSARTPNPTQASLTLNRVTFRGVGTGMSLPEGTILDATDTHFHDVTVGIEIRDRTTAINTLRSLGLPTDIAPMDFAQMLGELEEDPPGSDAEKLQRIGAFATAKQWFTGSFATAGGTIALVANLLKITESPAGKAAAAFIRSHLGP